jgi:hypothetical protein
MMVMIITAVSKYTTGATPDGITAAGKKLTQAE